MAQGSTAFQRRGSTILASERGSGPALFSRTIGALLALVVAWSHEREAFAEAPRWLLEWRAPEGCASESELRASVTTLLGAPVEEVLHEPLAVAGSVEVLDEGYRLRLLATGAHAQGERVAEAASCADVLRMAALLVALAIEPRFDENSSPSDSGPVTAAFPAPGADRTIPAAGELPPPTSAAAIPALAAPPRSPGRGEARKSGPPADAATGASVPPIHAARTPWRAHGPSPVTGAELGLAARLSAGDLPHVDVGGALSGMLALGKESLNMSLGGYLPQKRRVTGEPDGYAEFWSGELGLAWCHDLVESSIRLGPCLGGRAVMVRGDGTGLAEDAGRTALLLGPTLGASGSFAAMGPLRVSVEAQAHWRPARPRFVVDGERQVFRPSAVGGVVGFGAVLGLR